MNRELGPWITLAALAIGGAFFIYIDGLLPMEGAPISLSELGTVMIYGAVAIAIGAILIAIMRLRSGHT